MTTRPCRGWPGIAIALASGAGLASAWAETGAGNPLASGEHNYLWQLLTGMVLVLMAIAALTWLLKKINRLPNKGQDALDIVASLSVGPRERLLIVRSGNARILLGVAPGQIASLHVFDNDEPGANPAPDTFAEVMANQSPERHRS